MGLDRLYISTTRNGPCEMIEPHRCDTGTSPLWQIKKEDRNSVEEMVLCNNGASKFIEDMQDLDLNDILFEN